jgi:multisubunit Na+/H+ antiporter MnhC subunit
MSLKAFHLVFIMVSIALAFGFGVWLAIQGGLWNVIFAIGSFGAGVGLIFYERYFLKKTKNVSYL